MYHSFFLVCLAVFLFSCSSSHKSSSAMNKQDFLETLMKSKPEQFSDILQNRESWRVQIIYTKINRDRKNKPSFTDYTFHPDNGYFYPASTVKMPIAFLALEKLNDLHIPGVNSHTTMITGSTAVSLDNINRNNPPTIAGYIKQIFLVSDNNAFNHLYEFLGQGYIQQKLKEKGYPESVIRHRLQLEMTDDQNRATPPVAFYDTAGKLIYLQEAQYNKEPFPAFDVKLGKGYLEGNQLIQTPFDFSNKNRLNLDYLHNMEKSVLFPESVNEKQRFHLKEEDRNFLMQWMSAYPRESANPSYDSVNYWDTYCKFLLWGSEKGGSIPNSIRIFNKVGDAYGFLTDVAYIVDFDKKLEFMLSATILCNSDGIFNDDLYDYDTVGYPFMKHIGQLLYDYEVNRPKKHKAVLDKLSALQDKKQ